MSFLGLQKVCFRSQKHKKLIFSKNLNYVICPNIGFGFHSGPGDLGLGTIRPLQIIHLTKNRLLPTVLHQHFIEKSFRVPEVSLSCQIK